MNIKPTSEKAAEYWGFGKQCLELKAYGAKAVVDGLYTIVCKYTPDEAILIAIGGGSFISTPRLLSKNDGYDEKLTPQGSGSVQYPLEDSTPTSQILNTEDLTVERSAQLYGNIDWTGPNTLTPPESDAPVLTWRGPPSRYFPLSDGAVIPGLSTIDEELEGPPAVTVYTCFGPYIYQDGKVLATAPALANGLMPKVLGAAFFEGGDLVVIVGNNYREITGGFAYDAYHVKEGKWLLVGSTRSSRQKTPFFFNESGTNAATIQDNILTTAFFNRKDGAIVCSFSKDDKLCEGTYTRSKKSSGSSTGAVDPPGTAYTSSGEYTKDLVVTGTGTGTLTITRKESCKVAVDYQGNQQVFALIKRKDAEKSINFQKGTSTYELAPVYQDTTPPPLSGLTVFNNPSGGGEVGVGSTYSVNGGCGAITWSASGATISDQGILTAVNCTSGARAEVTVTATDGNGSSISRTDPTYGASVTSVRTFTGGLAKAWDCSQGAIGATTIVNSVSGADHTMSTYADVYYIATKTDCEGYSVNEWYTCPSPPCNNMLISKTTDAWICV